jgi:NADH-ubiquinone oxidoreductase chain 1
VSGFMTEHAAVIFVFFFLAEYASIILICILTSIIFLGGYEFFNLDKTLIEFITIPKEYSNNFFKYDLTIKDSLNLEKKDYKELLY